MHRIIPILMVLMLAGKFVGAQTNKIDSLMRLLPGMKEDTAKVMLLCSIGEAFEDTDPETAKRYLRQAASLNKKLQYPEGEFRYLHCYGGVCLVQGQFDSSIYYHQLALARAQALKDQVKIGLSLFNIGIGYREKAAFHKAVDYLLQGRKILEQVSKPAIVMQVNDALQGLYLDRRQYDKAIEFGEKAVALARELDKKEFLARFLINLSISYKKTSVSKARMALEEALRISQQMKLARNVATIELNLAWLALKEHNFLQAREYAEKNWSYSRKMGYQREESGNLYIMALCSLQEGKPAKAREQALEVLALCRNGGFKLEEINALRLLSGISYAEKDFVKGFDYDETMVNELEDLVSSVLSQQSAELEKQYETAQKESRIKQLEAEKQWQSLRLRQKNIINYILIGGAITLCIIILLLYLNYRQKQAIQQKKIHELQTEKQLAATESVLRGEEQERARLARDLHDGLGGILSSIKYSFNTMKGNLVMTPENQQAFERSITMLDMSIHEMRRVAHNLMPEALVKFGLDMALKDFCNDINQSGGLRLQYQSMGLDNTVIDSNTSITVYRIVQELVNNILKHAEASTALVQLIKNDDSISITVEDDGKGLDTAMLQQSKGMGWSNIHSRVNYLKGKMDIQSKPGEGTSVLIELAL